VFKLVFCDRMKVYLFTFDLADGKGRRETLCSAVRLSELVDSFPEGSANRNKIDLLVARARNAPHHEVTLG